jgi:hypothetical protein
VSAAALSRIGLTRGQSDSTLLGLTLQQNRKLGRGDQAASLGHSTDSSDAREHVRASNGSINRALVECVVFHLPLSLEMIATSRINANPNRIIPPPKFKCECHM